MFGLYLLFVYDKSWELTSSKITVIVESSIGKGAGTHDNVKGFIDFCKRILSGPKHRYNI